MRRRILLIIAGVVTATALTVVGRAIDSDEPKSLTRAQVEDIKAGGWRGALAPHSTIPVPSESGAEEVAVRLALKYCDDGDAEEIESVVVGSEYHMFVPSCLEIDLPENRLETPNASIEVAVGPLPALSLPGGQHCYVNVGAQFEDHGLCVKDLLKGAGG